IRTEYSTNKSSWTLLDETTLGEDPAAETKAYPYKAAASGTLQARYVKITVPNSTDVYMDEIKVLKEKTLVISTPDAESLDPNDIAIGCSYTTAWACNGNYADRGRDLTNGRRAPLRFSSPEWVGFHSNDGAAVGLTDFYVTVDLGAVKTFEQVKFGALSESAPGILPPSGAKIESSTDNTNWTLLTEEPTNFSGGDSVGRFCYSAKEPVSARYVRIHMVIPYNWLFIDEIEVLEKNDPLPDANVVPSNGREINLMRDYQSYTSSRPPEINDISGLLTDGKHGVTYTKYDKNWMGYQYNNTNADQNHVVLDFDLYAAASISQILICSKQDAEKQFILPKNLKLFISSDEEKWYEIKSFDGNMTSETLVWDGKVDAFKTANKTATMIYARYVRAE
ncbi:MAG: discoidin domain-containing protein, partial [Oscillospiraceae bacterium]